jgi:hypothetical protein
MERARELEKMETQGMKFGDPIKLAIYEKMVKAGPACNQQHETKQKHHHQARAGHQRAKSEAVLAPAKLERKEEIAQRYQCIQFLKRFMDEG